MDFNLLKILFAILAFQFLFVSFFLFQSKKGNALSNKTLGLVFFMLSIAIINFYWIVFGITTNIPQLLFIDDTFMLAYGPLLYIFTESILFKKYRLKKKSIIHFIPFMISVCYVIGLVFFVDASSILEWTDQIRIHQLPIYLRIGETLILLHILIYLFKSKKEIRGVFKRASELYSNFDQDDFELLRFIINCFIILFLLALIHSFLPFIGFSGSLLITLLSIVLFMFYFINSVLLKMLKRSTNDSGVMSQVNFENKEKYAGSKITQAQLKGSKSKLYDHMKSTKRYLNADLNIDDLSKEMGLSSKDLSQIINQGFSCNFFDFVNKFRVEEAKSIFSKQTEDKMTIQEVMYDSGFSSKSSFNTAFKKFTNLTPTQFKNTL